MKEFLPVVQGILDSCMEFRLWQFRDSAFLFPRPESLEKRFLAVDPFFSLLLRGKAVQFFFYLKQLIQPQDCFCGFGSFRVMDVFGQRVHKSAAQMGVTQASCGLPDPIPE